MPGGKAIQAAKKLGELEDLEEKGLLLVLPCKPGEPVYQIITQRDNFDDREHKIVSARKLKLNKKVSMKRKTKMSRKENKKPMYPTLMKNSPLIVTDLYGGTTIETLEKAGYEVKKYSLDDILQHGNFNPDMEHLEREENS
mgnify:CR=1 FL=1